MKRSDLQIFADRGRKAQAAVDATLPPASRLSDLESSKEAERDHTRSGARVSNKAAVLELVKASPHATARELAAYSTNEALDYHEIMRRLNDLSDSRDGRVWRGPRRRCLLSGRRVTTWTASIVSASARRGEKT